MKNPNGDCFPEHLGYVKPNQDFDFNVVIRSLLYNRTRHYLAYFAGSGITFNSDPEKEYEECLLKVAAFERIIKNPLHRKRNGLQIYLTEIFSGNPFYSHSQFHHSQANAERTHSESDTY